MSRHWVKGNQFPFLCCIALLLTSLTDAWSTSLNRYSSYDRCRRKKSKIFLRDGSYDSSQTVDDETIRIYNFWEGPLTTQGFNMDLHNLAVEDAQQAQDALEIMEGFYRQYLKNNSNTVDDSNPLYVKVNAACYTTVIAGWVNSEDKDAASRAQALLDHMEQVFDETGDTSIKPNGVTYLLVSQAWADSNPDEFTGESAQRAEAILRRMQQRGIQPDVKIYTAVLFAWCKRAGKVRGAMNKAESLLAEMEALSDQDAENTTLRGESVRPNVITYTTVIGGFARSKERDLATRAEAVLDRMERNGVDADMVAYTSVLNAWSKARSRKEREVAAKRAVALLTKMETLYANEQYHVKPNLISYATGINAIGNSLDPDGPGMAEEVLRRMYELREAGTINGIKPVTATYNAVITALARNKASRGPQNARRAEHLLVEMTKRAQKGEKDVSPNVRTFGGVMLAWAESGMPDAAENVQRVLDKMQVLYAQGQSTVEPNVVCYTTAMGAWTRSRRKDALDRAESILIHLEQQYEQTKNKDVRPNAISYVTMIDGFVRRKLPDAALKAQETVDRMMRLYAKGIGHIRPSRIVLNTLINAWSRSNEKNAAQKAEEILKWMEIQYRGGDEYVKPDEVSFCGVLNAWANHAENGGAQRAQQILEHMESLTADQRGFRQTVVCYNIVIKAWARSQERDAISHAEKILERLEQRNEPRADTTTYSSVINCCAYYGGPPEGKRKAFEVAMRTFNKLCSSKEERPNHVSYGTMLKAISKLIEFQSEREELVQKIFGQCCSDGQVEAFVVSQVRNSCSARVFQELVLHPIGFKGETASIPAILRKVPKRWSSNVID